MHTLSLEQTIATACRTPGCSSSLWRFLWFTCLNTCLDYPIANNYEWNYIMNSVSIANLDSWSHVLSWSGNMGDIRVYGSALSLPSVRPMLPSLSWMFPHIAFPIMHIYCCNASLCSYSSFIVNIFNSYQQYDTMISPQHLFYNVGVELTDDGQFRHQNYIKHAIRGTLTLHSLYLLLWANYGAFCIALLTQPESDTRMRGKLMSSKVPIRKHCLSKLKSLWKHMKINLNLTEEERNLFVTKAMMRFHEVKPISIWRRIHDHAFVWIFNNISLHNLDCIDSTRDWSIFEGLERHFW